MWRLLHPSLMVEEMSWLLPVQISVSFFFKSVIVNVGTVL